MGLGFVLLLFGVVALIASACGAVVLTGLVYLVERRRGRIRKGWLATAAALPFALLVYAGGAFAAYAVWCEEVRGVDIGIGDSWRVPLGNGYSFGMVDTPEQAFVEGPRGAQLHYPVRRIGVHGDVVAGEDDRRFFLVNVSQHTDASFASEVDLYQQLSLEGVGQLSLGAPDEFYMRHRWGAADGLAAVAIAVPPLAVIVFLGIRFARSPGPIRPQVGPIGRRL